MKGFEKSHQVTVYSNSDEQVVNKVYNPRLFEKYENNPAVSVSESFSEVVDQYGITTVVDVFVKA